MSRELDERAQELLVRVLAHDTDVRRAVVDRECDDTALRTLVHSLLDATERAGTFLDGPLLEGTPDAPSARSLVGTRIARYTIESVLATGGMGTVYVATQEQPTRTVALKVMRAGLTASALRRFEYESQILARLQHPHIAQVFEAGTHEDPHDVGCVPFFAMEYVAGARSITAFARDEHLDIPSTLRLFVDVCEAVHHAHQRGIIHRDLKPSNVIVDASGQVKVIDFGVARAHGSGAHTLRTTTGELVGTLGYMSPEQCAGRPDDLDIRSDVYSLGILLYELLCRRMPYDLENMPIYEAARVVREQPATRPSTTVPALRGDLETVLLKALEKERERRYASADALGCDLSRFLAGEPIEARPLSRIYQMRMFARRHKALVTALVVILVTLSAATTVSLSFAWRAKSEAEAARWQSYVADIAAAESSAQVGEYQRMRDRLAHAPGEHRGWEWWHLRRMSEPSLRTFRGHDHMVDAIALSPDGALLASGARDLTVRVWSMATGETLASFEGHTDIVRAVAFHPDGASVASGANDGTVRLWNIATGSSEVLDQRRNDVTGVAFSHDGRWIVLATTGGVHVHDLVNGTKRTLRHRDARSLAFDPAGTMLATGATNGSVRLWPWPEAGTSSGVARHEGIVRSLAFDPTGTRLVSTSMDRAVMIHSVDGARPPIVVEALKPFGAMFCADGGRVLVADQRQVRIIDASSGEDLAPLAGHEAIVSALAGAPNGRVLSGSWDHTIREWDVGGLDAFDVLRGHARGVRCVAFSPDGARVASAAADGTVRIWDLTTGVALAVLSDHRHETVSSLDFDPTGATLVSAGGDGELILWSADSGRVIDRMTAHGTSVGTVTFSPDGALIASSSWDRTIHLWDPYSGTTRRLTAEGSGPIPSVAFSPDGTRLASASHDGAIRIWDVASGAVTFTLVGHDYQAYAVAFHPDGAILASGARDHDIKLWSLETRSLIATRRGHGEFTGDLEFSPDGSRLVSASRSGALARVRDASTGVVLASLIGHGLGVRSVDFAPDGSVLATASEDGTVRLWDTIPFVERTRRREIALAKHDQCVPIVDALRRTHASWDAVATALRADGTLDDDLRRAALNEVLRASSRAP